MVIACRGFLLCQYFVQLELQDAVQPLQPFRVNGEHGVAGKAECPQLFQIGADAVGQKSACRCNKIGAKPRRTVPDAPFRIFQLVVVQIKQQAAVVIKNGCHFLDLQRVVLEQDTKISAVPVGVQDKRIQNAHPPEGVAASDAFKIAQKSGDRTIFCQDSGLSKAVAFAGKKGALGDQFSMVETEVIDCRSRAKKNCQLRSQILRHRLHAEYAAGLVQLNAVLLPYPAFGVLSVCAELRGGGREARAGHRTVKSSLRDHLVERVLIKRNVPPLQVGICCPDPEGIVQ